MNPAIITAGAALLGALIGSLTSLVGTVWTDHRNRLNSREEQVRMAEAEREKARISALESCLEASLSLRRTAISFGADSPSEDAATAWQHADAALDCARYRLNEEDLERKVAQWQAETRRSLQKEVSAEDVEALWRDSVQAINKQLNRCLDNLTAINRSSDPGRLQLPKSVRP